MSNADPRFENTAGPSKAARALPGSQPSDGSVAATDRRGPIIAACGSAVAVLAFVALPMLTVLPAVTKFDCRGCPPYTLTALQFGLDPESIGPDPWFVLVLLWLFLVAALVSLCVAVWQWMYPRPGPDRRGVLIAALSGIAFLIYFGLLVGALLDQPLTPRPSTFSRLGLGFWLGLVGTLVAVIGGRNAVVAARRRLSTAREN